MPFELLIPGLIAGVIPLVVAIIRRRWVLATVALVMCINAGFLGGYVFAVPMGINFLVTALAFPPRKRQAHKETPPERSNIDWMMVGAGVALLIALLLPWLSLEESSVTALGMFGEEVPREAEAEIPAIFIIPISAIVGTLAGLVAVFLPNKRDVAAAIGIFAGINTLIYFVSFFFRGDQDFAVFGMLGIGAWLALLAGIALIGQYLIARPGLVRQSPAEAFTTYKRSRAGLYFLLPGVYWILTFTFFPLLYSLYLSFTDARMRNFNSGFDFIGFENYADVFTDDRIIGIGSLFSGEHVAGAIETSVFMSITSTVLTIVLGTFVAWLFNQEIPGLRVFRSILTMPMFAAPIALGFLGLILFNENSGPINYFLQGFGSDGVKWMTSPWSARSAVMMLDTWQWTPFVFIIVLAAMQSIPDELYEAARLDTASAWVLFRRITLPLIAPALGTVALLRLVETFKILDIPLSMLGGGPGAATQTYSYYIYITGLQNFDMGYGAAQAYLLVIVAVIISSIYFWRVRTRFE
jgi:multiple sugar transport system permease protein